MRAYIKQRIIFAVATAIEQYRATGDFACQETAGFSQFGCMAKVQPAAIKDCCIFPFKRPLVGKRLAGHKEAASYIVLYYLHHNPPELTKLINQFTL
jgi:hypothetical protein